MKAKPKTSQLRGTVGLPLVGPEAAAHESIIIERRPVYLKEWPDRHTARVLAPKQKGEILVQSTAVAAAFQAH